MALMLEEKSLAVNEATAVQGLSAMWEDEHLIHMIFSFLQPVELLTAACCNRFAYDLCVKYDRQLWLPHIRGVWSDCVRMNVPNLDQSLIERLRRKYDEDTILQQLTDVDTSTCCSLVDFSLLLQSKMLFGALLERQRMQQQLNNEGAVSVRKRLWPTALSESSPTAARRHSDSTITVNSCVLPSTDEEAPPISSPSSITAGTTIERPYKKNLLHFPSWTRRIAPYKATYIHSVLERCRSFLYQEELVTMKWRFRFRVSNNPDAYCHSSFFEDGTMRLDVSENIYFYEMLDAAEDGKRFLKVDDYPTLSCCRRSDGRWCLQNLFVTFTQVADSNEIMTA